MRISNGLWQKGLAFFLVGGVAFFASAGWGHASSSELERYLTVGSVEFEQQEVPLRQRFQERAWPKFWQSFFVETPSHDIAPGLTETEALLDQVENLGKRVWTAVAANAPVTNYKANFANALPVGLGRWEEMQGWKNPISRVYRVTYKNLYGVKVVDFSFRVLFTYNGNVNGKGRYISHATIIPDELSVAWGYTFDAEVTVPQVVNVGSHANPVAGIELMLHWSVDTVLKRIQSSASYFVRGDGQFLDLTHGN